MTEAEVMELIKTKKEDLEKRRSAGVSTAELQALEDEIKKLEESVPKPAARPRRVQQTFLDECAG